MNMLSCRLFSIILLIFPTLICVECNSHSSSSNQGDSSTITRHFYYHADGTDYYAEHNVTISSSFYFTQRLINELIKQLLSRKLGYHSVKYVADAKNSSDGWAPAPNTNCSIKVKFDAGYNPATLRPSTNSSISGESCVELDWHPDPLIIIQSSNDDLPSDFTDAGALGLSNGYGFYMSSSVVEQIWNEDQIIANTYSSMHNELVIKKFVSYNPRIMQALGDLQTIEDSERVCAGASPCSMFTHSTPTCQLSSCPILLVGNSGFSMEELRERITTITNQSLYVMYVGDDLTSLVLNLSSSDIPVIFFSSSLDMLSIDPSFARVRSWEPEFGADSGHFPRAELRKAVWAGLIKSEPLIHKLIRNVVLSEGLMLSMLQEYRASYLGIISAQSIEQYVSEWLSRNAVLASRWKPAGADEPPDLLLGGFFPLDSGGAWKEPSLVLAAQMAIKLINNNTDILRDYRLRLLVNDTHCDYSFVLNTFTQYLLDEQVWPKMVGGLGPACSDTALTVVPLATHHNYVMISYAVEAMVLSLVNQRYKYFFRTVPQINDYAAVYVALFKKLNVKKVSMLTDYSSGEFPVYHHHMGEHFKEQGIKLATQDLLPRRTYILEVNSNNPYEKYLDKIKAAGSFVIVMDVFVVVGRSIMCEAYRKKMTLKEGYFWFLPATYMWDWYDDNSTSCTKDEMTEAIRGYFTLSHVNIDRSPAVAVGDMTGTEFEAKYQTIVDESNTAKYAHEYGSYTYDAVWTFAKALQSLYEEKPGYLKYIHTPYATERYVAMINHNVFQGVSGLISFNENGDRSGITRIEQYYLDDPFDGFLIATTVGNWTNGNLTLNLSLIQFGGRMEQTTTSLPIEVKGVQAHCEWEHLRVTLNVKSCSAALLVIVIPTCALVILIIVIGSFAALRKAKRKYRLAAELAQYGEGRGYSSFHLDEKEILRDHVVLNRKLGEGAFGTVYGGEAYINSIWTGVAVKTLQIGSNSEDKLDFLREADIMKRFEHKNVVKLLGVTTRGQPAYAIMEFMLYGDLKTYLLSRRELVGLDEKEAADISPGSLTHMALDIAEGLHYLHTKEYIHRDIACRNCLVSSSRTVKIGDFGMARRVYDDGSYIFTRRGRLPVRWMAPESFVDGIFTYKTDIWSFGVLLYEIITFGSIPYHMSTNAEVFEIVKAGSHLTLPEECTDELKSLMLECWRNDPKQRPSAIDIYATLRENENMIQPLLAGPALSKIGECDAVEVDLSLKKPFLRQSSSVISVDNIGIIPFINRLSIQTGMSTFSRHRNHSEVSYKRSISHRRRSSHSIVDLFSLVNPGNPSPITPISLPSPSHSTGHNSNFHFAIDNRHTCDDNATRSEAKSLLANHEGRLHHLQGSIAIGTNGQQQVIAENDYLLTTRSCTDIDDRSHHSHTPLIHTDETEI